MRELDDELWRLGVPAKTEHNEVAPGQYELASVFATANIACDHNQIMMELMRKVALRHGLACLLHEKPFAGVNGSGKHNNWSLVTSSGKNLLDPTDDPGQNPTFLVFLCAVLAAVDDYADLLRLSATCPGNEFRLGGGEAPPSVISVFLGDPLEQLLAGIAEGHIPGKSARAAPAHRRKEPASADAGRQRPQPHQPLCLHRQQVRVPHGGRQPEHRPGQRRAGRRCGRHFARLCRPAGSRRGQDRLCL